MEAPSMLQAHTNAMARDLAGGLAFGEVHELSTKMAATIPPEQIDRMLSGKEAAHMIVRLVEGRGRPEEMTGRFPRPWRMVEHALLSLNRYAWARTGELNIGIVPIRWLRSLPAPWSV
jgi:predicted DCC family thiol-disulfide oxidoreductase YuxK